MPAIGESRVIPVPNPGVAVPEDLDRLQALDTESLKQELAKSLQVTARELLRLAWIIRTLEDRGEDLSGLRIPLLQHLRRIAYGQCLPETVVRFAAFPMLLQRVASLPLPEQQRLAEGGAVTLVVRREDNTFDLRQADPLKLTRDQIVQVFGPDRVRDQAEQILILEDRAGRPVRRLPAQQGIVRPDPERRGILVNRTFVPHAEVLTALAGLAPEPEKTAEQDQGQESVHTPVYLSRAEHRALKILAAQQGTSMGELIRQAMRAHGLLARDEKE